MAAHIGTKSRASSWLPVAFDAPDTEFVSLLRPPAAKLLDQMVSLPYEERRQRVLNVGRAMLHILAIQHELEEPFNLNGDLFEDVHEEYGRAMFLATKPRQLTHKKHWDKKAFGEALLNFRSTHLIFDPVFRPITYVRLGPRESRRPVIVIDIRNESPVEAGLIGTIRARDDGDDDDEESPGPPSKRRATRTAPKRQLRSRDNKPCKARKTSPQGKVVAKGRGWVTVEMDESG
ncbi:hypothetical protein K438DRAFT_1820727 [Mycena galopus ATCC 62051]|nr:hypothetical protein K438DRAFT_1820727 [Mycena galopus ATCC 62051]